MKLNLKMWNEERLSTEKAIRDLKALIRKSGGHEVPYTDYATKTQKMRLHPGGTYAEYIQLRNLKYRASTLYSVRSHLRGRYPLTDEQQAYLFELTKELLCEELTESVPGALGNLTVTEQRTQA